MRYRKDCRYFVVISLVLWWTLLLLKGQAWASQDSETHQVTIQVPEILSIEASASNFTLALNDFVSGSESDSQTIQYTVKSNKNLAAQGAVLIKAKLDSNFQDLDLSADVGAYTKQGGNASLTEAASGNVKILATDTNLAKKVTDSGNGRIIRGVLPITYKAKATADLSAGQQVRTLTLTFTDT